MNINDLPIPIRIPIHQRGLISSFYDYYQGSNFLSTSPLTTATETTVTLEKLMGLHLLRIPEQEITVPDFKFNRLTLFGLCGISSKRLTDLSSSSTKCHQCPTSQRTTHLIRESSIRICVVHNSLGYQLIYLSLTI